MDRPSKVEANWGPIIWSFCSFLCFKFTRLNVLKLFNIFISCFNKVDESMNNEHSLKNICTVRHFFQIELVFDLVSDNRLSLEFESFFFWLIINKITFLKNTFTKMHLRINNCLFHIFKTVITQGTIYGIIF